MSNSLLGMVQGAIYNRRITKTSIVDPVFVLGHWRSGTTHLHELLALDERYAFPTTFECSAPHHCLLTGGVYPKLFSWLLPGKRVMDDMKQGFNRPQEDELALVALGAASPMWSLAYSTENKGQAYLTLRDISATERKEWEQLLLKFLRLVTYRRRGKRLILKSPAHTGRLAVLAKLFPTARFLHIVRDPYEVFASTVHLWRRTQAVSALTQGSEQELEDYVLRSLRQMYDGFDAVRASLSPGRFHQVRYEQLIAEPTKVLEESYRALGLGDFAPVRSRVETHIESIGDYRTNQYEISSAARDAVSGAWGTIFRGWGYDICRT